MLSASQNISISIYEEKLYHFVKKDRNSIYVYITKIWIQSTMTDRILKLLRMQIMQWFSMFLCSVSSNSKCSERLCYCLQNFHQRVYFKIVNLSIMSDYIWLIRLMPMFISRFRKKIENVLEIKQWN